MVALAKKETMSLSSLSSQSGSHSSSVDYYSLSETELTLGLPGTKIAGIKRGFSDTVDLRLATSSTTTTSTSQNSGNNLVPSTPKGSVVGWPPVRANRKNVMKSCNYVKVAVDGAPYLRKVDLEIYDSYEHLLRALENMFGCLTIRNCNHLMNEKKFMDCGNVIEYIPTYEDKDGDWMLVGDVPWKMFTESCKKIRLMISSEDIHLAPMRTISKCRGSSEKNNDMLIAL